MDVRQGVAPTHDANTSEPQQQNAAEQEQPGAEVEQRADGAPDQDAELEAARRAERERRAAKAQVACCDFSSGSWPA